MATCSSLLINQSVISPCKVVFTLGGWSGVGGAFFKSTASCQENVGHDVVEI